MTNRITEATVLSIGQLAKRWSVTPERVRRLVEAGHLAGAFRIPSAGRFGETMKIPLEVVRRAETDWSIAPISESGRKRFRRQRQLGLSANATKHFPELSPSAESAAECRAGDPHSNGHNGAGSG